MMSKEHNQRQFCKLRGLNRSGTKPEPPVHVCDLRTKEDQSQKRCGNNQSRVNQNTVVPFPVRDVHHHRKTDASKYAPDELTNHEVKRTAVLFHCDYGGGRINHDEAKHHEHHRDREQQLIRAQLSRHRLTTKTRRHEVSTNIYDVTSRIAARNTSPRCS